VQINWFSIYERSRIAAALFISC